MKEDHSAARFFGYLSFFTFFMSMLVLSSNFFVFYVAWEGVGISSFLLIGFWHTRAYASKAAVKALFVNKFGDIFLFLAIVIIASGCKSLDFSTVFPLIPVVFAGSDMLIGGYNYIDLISLFLLMAALIKSAQLFFHIWLADAMEGPTPVSALLHAATMVTAGVFLIIRCSFIFEYSPAVLYLLVYISVGSIISIGLVGLSQHDIKKIIAYSTCSQLGFMFLACGLSGYNIALFHFFNHAFFKALLFLSAGVLIHNLNNEQDIRKMGGLRLVFPFTYVSFLIGSLSMVGFPFFSGYYSKDAIVMLAYARLIDSGEGHYLLYYLILFSLFITCLYSFKIIFYVFLGESTNISSCSRGRVKEELSFFGAAPIVCLNLLSMTSGFFFKDYFIGAGSNYLFESSILTLHDEIKHVMFFKEQKLILLFLLIISYVLCIIYSYYANSIYYIKLSFYFNKFLYKVYCFFNRRGFFDELYNIFLSSTLYRFGYSVYKSIDRGLLEVFGPSGIKFLLRRAAVRLKKFLYSGFISNQVHFAL
jgi:NADH-quinone oxidoreductase subunit L